VGWHYDNKKDPNKTICVVKDAATKEELQSASIVRHVNDPQLGGMNRLDKDGRVLSVQEANDRLRRLSLDKLLDTYYTGPEFKAIRTAFWQAYNGRK